MQYQYETSPRKLEPAEERMHKKNKRKKQIKVVKDLPRQDVKISKEQRAKEIKLIAFSLVALLLLLVISYRNSQISVKFSQIQSQKQELAVLQKENEQTEVNIENSLNLSNIEEEAKTLLGMQKLTNKQTVYVTLPKKDYVEPATEEVVKTQEKNWFQQFVDKIFNR